jgi:hypothetical protein
MPFTKFTNLDFDQIRTSIKDYLRANSNFTDFDFEGSNFSVLIDALAYNTYINSFNANMVVNESFLDSATVRENVVSLARAIGYIPRSRSASRARVSIAVSTKSTSPTLTLKAGLVCVGSSKDTSYIFSIPEDITTVINSETAIFGTEESPIEIYQGTYLTKEFVVDGSIDQRFILDNSFIDSSTIMVRVKGPSDVGLGREYKLVDNILNIDKTSEIYLLQEIPDEKYEILFGDGIFGKKLENNSIITVSYIITDGKDGNGASNFSFSGSFVDSSNIATQFTNATVRTFSGSSNGGDIESLESIKYYAPRLYSSQYRAVTGRDYESIIQQIYPNTESVSVIGGEEMEPPRYGTVLISIKPKNGDFVSDFDKQTIINKLKSYSVSGIRQELIDLKVLYVEIDSSIYYNTSKVSNAGDLKTSVYTSLSNYADSMDVNKFGGRFKYSKVLQMIDSVDDSITSNITTVKIRRNLRCLINQAAQYELCFGNQFHVNMSGFNIKSTAFKIAGQSDFVYFTDVPNADGKTGVLSVVKQDLTIGGSNVIVVKSAGTLDYLKGEIVVNTLLITETALPNDIVEIQAFPESNDVIGLKDLYLQFDISKSTINMVKDTISSGEQISGVGYKVTSSYTNNNLKRG